MGNVITGDDMRKGETMAQLAALQAKAGEIKAAVATLDTIPLEQHKGWAASDIAEARAKAGDVEGALAWALTLRPPALHLWALRGTAMGSRPR